MMPYLLFYSIVMSVCFWSYYQRVEAETQRRAEATALHRAQIEKLKELAVQESTDVQTVYVDRIKTVRTQAQTLIKKVPIYVTAKHDRDCPIPDDFVRLWNYSNQAISLDP
ncbi:MAG: hypothetical protein ACR2HF_02095 [Methylococcaceae bacterium]